MPVEDTRPLTLDTAMSELTLENTSSNDRRQIIRLVRDDHKRSKHKSKSRQKETGTPTKKRSRHSSRRAILEDLKESNRWRAILTEASALLETEHRVSAEATARAERAERKERDALDTLQALQDSNHKLQMELCSEVQSSRGLQHQLEMNAQESRHGRTQLELLRQEFEQLDTSLRRSEKECRKYKNTLYDWEEKMDDRQKVAQSAVTKAFGQGETTGYEAGYNAGYTKGKLEGKQQGIKIGRKEGILEGIEQGRLEERRSALDAIDKFLTNEGESEGGEIRRWAQSVYQPEHQEDFSDRFSLSRPL